MTNKTHHPWTCALPGERQIDRQDRTTHIAPCRRRLSALWKSAMTHALLFESVHVIMMDGLEMAHSWPVVRHCVDSEFTGVIDSLVCRDDDWLSQALCCWKRTKVCFDGSSHETRLFLFGATVCFRVGIFELQTAGAECRAPAGSSWSGPAWETRSSSDV